MVLENAVSGNWNKRKIAIILLATKDGVQDLLREPVSSAIDLVFNTLMDISFGQLLDWTFGTRNASSSRQY